MAKSVSTSCPAAEFENAGAALTRRSLGEAPQDVTVLAHNLLGQFRQPVELGIERRQRETRQSFDDCQRIARPDAKPLEDLVPLGDGFAIVTGHGFGGVPKGSDPGWRFSVAEGWSSLPPVPDLPGWNVQSGVPVVVGGQLIIVVNLQKSDGSASATGVIELRDEGWTVPQRVSDVSIGLPQAVAMGDLIAVVGANTTDGRSPLVIDPQAGRATVMDDYPIPTVIDQSVVWSGMELFIWGGQTSQRDGEASTSATGTFSADGAIWRP